MEISYNLNSELIWSADLSPVKEDDATKPEFEDSCDCDIANNQRILDNKNESKVCSFKDIVEHPRRNYECLMCNYKTFQAGHYNRHLKTHMGQNVYKCNLCNYEAGEASTLERHMRTHTGEKPYQCEYCSKTFKQHAHWSYHVKSHVRKIYESCDLDMESIEVLSDVTVNREKSFTCDKCDYRSAYRNDLRDHKRMHTNERPYKCSLCNYKAIRSSHLKRHKRIHTRDRPNKLETAKCAMCDFQSTSLKGLKNHMRKHDREVNCLLLETESKIHIEGQ